MMGTALRYRVGRAKNALGQYPALLVDRPHLNPQMARQGRSLRSQCVFLLNSAGNAGKTRACKLIEEAVRRIEEPALRLAQPCPADGAKDARGESRHNGKANRP